MFDLRWLSFPLTGWTFLNDSYFSIAKYHSMLVFKSIYRVSSCGNAPVKLFYPYPSPLPRHPRVHHYFCFTPVFLSIYFCLAPPFLNSLITLFSSAPPFFITHIFPLTPGLPEGDGGRTIWPVHYGITALFYKNYKIDNLQTYILSYTYLLMLLILIYCLAIYP